MNKGVRTAAVASVLLGGAVGVGIITFIADWAESKNGAPLERLELTSTSVSPCGDLADETASVVREALP